MSSAKAKKREPRTTRITKRVLEKQHATTKTKVATTEQAKATCRDNKKRKNTKRCPGGLKVTSRRMNAASQIEGNKINGNKINGLFRLSTDAWTLIREFLPPQDAASLVVTCRTAYEMILTDMLRGKKQEDMPIILRCEARDMDKKEERYSFLVQSIKSKNSMERRMMGRKNHLRWRQSEEPFCTDHGQRLQIHFIKIFDSASISVYKKTSKAKKWKKVYGIGIDYAAGPLVNMAIEKCWEHLGW